MKYKLKTERCVNSEWPASWLRPDYKDHCQCAVECKVILIDERGNNIIVTEKEYNKLMGNERVMPTINYKKLPVHIRGGAKRYIEEGQIPGSFLIAVICNRLMESFFTADDTNLDSMFDIVAFFHNEAPSECHGSEEKMELWMEKVRKGNAKGGDYNSTS